MLALRAVGLLPLLFCALCGFCAVVSGTGIRTLVCRAHCSLQRMKAEYPKPTRLYPILFSCLKTKNINYIRYFISRIKNSTPNGCTCAPSTGVHSGGFVFKVWSQRMARVCTYLSFFFVFYAKSHRRRDIASVSAFCHVLSVRKLNARSHRHFHQWPVQGLCCSRALLFKGFAV